MSKLIKAIACVAFAAICGNLFAYNGGYENSIVGSTTIDGKTYAGYGNNTLTAREESGTTIPANKYAQCSKLTSVNLANVTSIGNAAFAYSALTSVELPSTLKSLGYIAFGGCKNLSSITINSTAFMTSADEAKEPFRDCTALKTVTAKCAPPAAWDFKKVFPNVTAVKVPQASLSAWQKAYPTLSISPNATYNIKFCNNDNSGRTKTVEFQHGVSTALPKFETFGWNRNGFSFLGWAKVAGGAIVYNDGAAVSAPVAAGQTMSLYPVWSMKSGYYVLRFNANDGSGRMWSVGFQYGVATSIPKIATGFCWTRPGYTFKGWSTSAGSTAVAYADNATVTTAAKAGEKVDLYAVWAPAVKAVAMAVNPVSVDSTESVFAPGYYRGIFADGTGTFDLLLEEGGMAFIAAWTEGGDWTGECASEIVGTTLLLTLENDQIVIRKDGGLILAE